MNRKLLSLLLILISNVVHAADTNPPPRLTIDLRDGSRVIGTSIADNFRFHSELLGDMKLPIIAINSLYCISTNTVKLNSTNNDSLTVSFIESSIGLKTSFGKVNLAVDSIKKLSVSANNEAHPPGLVALWSGEGSGKDSVGGHDAELTDITFTDGKVGQAFQFNGVSSTIRVPANESLNLGSSDGFTIMAWIKPSDVNGLHPLIQWSDYNPLNLWIGIRPSENGVLRGDITDSQNHFVCSVPNTLMAGVFQHIAFTYDKSSGMGVLYLNGVVVAKRMIGSQLVAASRGDIWFSQRDDSPGNWSTGRMFSGLMDEIALYNRALSADEIQTICTTENQGETLSQPTPSSGWFESWMR